MNHAKTLGFFGINPEFGMNNWQAEQSREAVVTECRILISQKICLIINGVDDFSSSDSCTRKLKSDQAFKKLSVVSDMNQILMFLNSRAEYNDRTYGELANQITDNSYLELQELLLRYNRAINVLNRPQKYLEFWQIGTIGAKQISYQDFIGYNSVQFDKSVEPMLEFEGRIYLKFGNALKKNLEEIALRLMNFQNPIFIDLN